MAYRGPANNAVIVPVTLVGSGFGANSAPLPVTLEDAAGNPISASASRTTDSIASSLATDALMNGNTVLTPIFASISSTGSANTVAAVGGKKIRIVSMFIVVAGATTVQFQSNTTSNVSGAMSFATNGGISLPFNPVGWFQTNTGEGLNHVLGTSVGFAGGLTYITV
jgi:hypothetical protein